MVSIRPTAAAALSACVATLVLVLYAPPGSAAEPAAPAMAAPAADPLAAPRALFQRAADGDDSAVEPAAARWQALSDAAPGDPVRRAYAGAATAMRARATLLPWRKLAHAEDGLAQLDKALAQLGPAHEQPATPGGLAPALEVRFTAASTFLALPSMFHRHERGEKLLADVLTHPRFADAPAGFRAGVWRRAGRTAESAAARQRP